MARIPRKCILQDKSFFHVTWKCHNNDFLMKHEGIKQKLYSLLKEYKSQFRIKIFGYCFMDNHPHIVGFCETVTDFSAFFQIVNGRLARHINRVLGRKGQVVMDRLRSPQIETEQHMAQVVHYVDLNPVRAGICKRAKDFKWSSYRHHAFGQNDELIDALPRGLAFDSEAYRDLNRLILQQGRQKKLIFSKLYFFGTPQWMRWRLLELQRSLHSPRSERTNSISKYPT